MYVPPVSRPITSDIFVVFVLLGLTLSGAFGRSLLSLGWLMSQKKCQNPVGNPFPSCGVDNDLRAAFTALSPARSSKRPASASV